MKFDWVGWLAGLLLFSIGVSAQEEARLLRYADIHDDRVAFVYAGDIWIASSSGGEATRLTSHHGMELFPKFSPDGRWIAFSAEYSGNRQVWVMSVDGGMPRQLTYYNDVGAMPPRGGFDYRVLGWTPDGKNVLFRGNRLPWGVRMGRPFVIPVDGGMERPLAVPETGGGMLSPDGKRYVYTPVDREFRTWKRHEGGRAQDVWIYDLESDRSEQLTTHRRTDNQPVWVDDTIYFTSDRNDRMNLFAYDLGTKQLTQVTDHEDFDVLWPSAGPGAVVYECGGYLYRFDTASRRSTKIPIRLRGDFPHTMPRIADVSGDIASGDVSPSGQRAVFGARGDLFSVPAEDGEVRNLTRSSGVREIEPVWSPDGRWIAYYSDRHGEYDLYVREQDGSGDERRITKDGDIWRFSPVWSPDSKKIAYGDKKQRLRYVEVESGKTVDVDRSSANDITTYVWSPDSAWLAYTKVGASQFSSIWLYSTEERRLFQLTDDYTNDGNPAWDPQGRYLYFTSDRDYNLSFSGYEFNYFYTNPTRVYAGLLQADGPALFQPKSDEETPQDDTGKDKGQGAGEKDEDDTDEDDRLRIDVEGFGDRVVALMNDSGNFANVEANEKAVFFTRFAQSGPPRVEAFLLDDEEVKTVLEGIGGFTLSADGKKMFYAMGGGRFGIAPAKPGQKGRDHLIDLDGMTMKIVPQEEWKQIYHDFHRITRDWFYDPVLHGLDWDGMKRLYAPLVEHVRHRGDLDYIFGEMGGELNAGHFYVNWGDMPSVERRDSGLLGAEIEADRSGYFRIAEILPGENWQSATRSPLTETGVDVSAGELILAVDGRSTKSVKNFYELMEGTAGRTITLTVNDEPAMEGARDVQVRPINRETNLRYLKWVAERRRLVEEWSGGRVGYIHMPNTAAPGNRELRKWFYPQAHKDALIFDVRYNGGGFIPDRMIELLTRQSLGGWKRRGLDPQPSPGYAHLGPKACLLNAYSSSGGDAFPYFFRLTGQGKLFGTRSWGGLIGLSGNPGFVDGGSINVPTFRYMNPDGEWAVENVGVEPDVEVIDRPELVARGQDPTLEAAVKHLMEQLRNDPPKKLQAPASVRYRR